LLERIVESGVDDPYPEFLLSVSYLHLDLFSRAQDLLKIHIGKRPEYMPAVQLDAFLRLKSASGYEEALKFYLELIERYPADAHLRKAGKMISGTRDFTELQKSARIYDFVEIPSTPARLKKAAGSGIRARGIIPFPDKQEERVHGETGPREKLKPWILKAAVILLPMVLVGTGGYFYFSKIENMIKTGKNAAGKEIDMVTISGNDYDLIKRVNRKENPEFYNSVDDMKKDFDHARSLIKEGKMNSALRLLNKIRNSNVSYIVKEKVDFLVRFVRESDERVYEKIPVSQTEKRPWLYRGFAVSWNGRIANLKKKNRSSTFTLLVDYHGQDRFSATVEVYTVADTGDLKNGDMALVEGILMNRISGGPSLYVVGKNVYRPEQAEGAGGK